MSEFTLATFCDIIGISAASGIEYQDGQIYLLSDHSNYLYHYEMASTKLHKYVLQEHSPMEQIEKPKKLDLEAMLYQDGRFYVFGSGSTPLRELGFSFSPQNQQVDKLSLSDLYQRLRATAQIDELDFNLEAAASYGDHCLFLNRGNGPAGRNVLFTISDINKPDSAVISAVDIALPQVNGLPFGFSGATLLDDTLFFIATAEEGKSTYEDGKIGGTLFGIIDLKTLKIVFTTLISKDQKFEGISVYQLHPDRLSFLLCEDNDGLGDTATIYKLALDYPIQ
ncbi:hypothetical protein GQF61_05785 [Sphingobacterium sp. DK4209]|uniref:Phytase-like domain-containing protein n=1 Tax=Sphingobacterium zhuxiongii TaxID=2662364 RepID=A0A5Q0QFU9_9SPHI|nr:MULTISPECIES: hypothetical protein [unclassified Sphingobacterium]MVZ65358.1 hypothetical protein [Sphingobacterium sp. DK4209]QGA26442.1 hypothetical protein GFH32_08925 [Sphingobacterium sp. dk4302]